jgi:DNA topoisomerase-1
MYLVIVESPGKIAKISGFLGKDYVVDSSKGHIRDLVKKPGDMGIDFDNNFEPSYEVSPDKKTQVQKLRALAKNAELVYLAVDMDREGEAIAESLRVELHLKKGEYKRMIFDNITKEAIKNAVKNAGDIRWNIDFAQKARRVIDRIVGFKLSPVVKNAVGGPSAGRVQSVVLRLVVEKENEIRKFLANNSDSSFFKVNGKFNNFKSACMRSDHGCKISDPIWKGGQARIQLLNAPDDIDDEDEKKEYEHRDVTFLLKKCLKSTFSVHSISERVSTRNPSPPFETATLQQEASRKCGFSSKNTMQLAQKLYEGGYITYMRTDSVILSKEGHEEIEKVIRGEYGDKYYKKTEYENKSANAQEAHEAIRPVHPELVPWGDLPTDSELKSIRDEVKEADLIKLYDLIWKRTVASQMAPAKINVIAMQIGISYYEENKTNPFYYFQSEVENIIFPGFMKLYIEGVDDEKENEELNKDFTGSLPKKGEKLTMQEVIGKQDFLRPPPRYTEASLCAKMKELGIGRPSTYEPSVSRLMDDIHRYVEKASNPGIEKDVTSYKIRSENGKMLMKVIQTDDKLKLGKDANKLIPTHIGEKVCEFLLKYFDEIMQYKFTADLEKELDDISNGKILWYKVVKKFYDRFLPILLDVSKKAQAIKTENDRLLGKHQGVSYYAGTRKFGDVVFRINGEGNKSNEDSDEGSEDESNESSNESSGEESDEASKKQPKRKKQKEEMKSIKGKYDPKKITLDEAIKLFEYPLDIGLYNKIPIKLYKNAKGTFIMYDREFVSYVDEDISLNDAKELILKKFANVYKKGELKDGKTVYHYKVLNGPHGPYISATKGASTLAINKSIPQEIDPKTITDEEILLILKTFVKKGTGTGTNTKEESTKEAGTTKGYAKSSGSKTNYKTGGTTQGNTLNTSNTPKRTYNKSETDGIKSTSTPKRTYNKSTSKSASNIASSNKATKSKTLPKNSIAFALQNQMMNVLKVEALSQKKSTGSKSAGKKK